MTSQPGDVLASTQLSLRARLSQYVRAALNRSASLRRFAQVGFVLGGVLVAGLSEVASNSLAGAPKAVAQTLWFVGLALAFVGGILLSAFEQDSQTSLRLAQEALGEGESLKLHIAQQDSDLDQASSHAQWLARLYTLTIAHREIVEQNVAISRYEGSEALSAQISSLLDLLVADKETFFGIRDEHWNFAVYAWDEEDKELFCAACRRPHVSEAEREHRRWKSGEGHVGLALERGREFVEADLADPETAKFFATPADKERTYDSARYRSIASIPAIVGDTTRGVIVATSDIPGRFKPDVDQEVIGRDPVEALRLTAATIAILSELAHIQARAPGEESGEVEAPA